VGGYIYVGSIAVIVWFTAHYYRNVPSPGKAIAILGAAAVLMAVRGELMGHPEKIIWMLLVFALLYIEIRAIDKDRTDNQNQQASMRTEETRNFDKILENNRLGIAAILEGQRVKFEATMQQFATSQSHTERQFAATMSEFKEITKTETGGDSFCWIDLAVSPDGTGVDIVHHKGKYPLRSVRAWVTDEQKFAQVEKAHPKDYWSHPRSEWGFVVPIGEVWAQQGREHGGVTWRFTDPSSNRQDYNISFTALNGTWVEILRFRRVGTTWERALQVYSEGPDKVHILIPDEHTLGYPTKDGKVDWKSKD
jgi:hypothetical protein